MQEDRKIFYRRRLPHFQPANETFHVIFRLAGSLPIQVIQTAKQEREEFLNQVRNITQVEARKRLLCEWLARYSHRFDDWLNCATVGPFWLKNPLIADIVAESIRFRDPDVYDLLAYCIMPNHVHMLITVVRSDASLYRIIRSLKSFSARESNLILGRSGAFWQHESYDHVVRSADELERTVWYIMQNPVKAGFCSDWQAWKWSYVRSSLIEE